ncbi:MAG: arylamine N-acetyltransferase [Roseiflexaceae bacterium]
MDTQAYLRRIHYHGDLAPTAATLRELHRAHLLAVPFENLDIHLGRPIQLAQEALFEKIVMHRRGGFCYELNGLFAVLLRELGFEVTLLAAGVARANGSFGPPFDHLTLLVRIQAEPTTHSLQSELWLADVGFGDSFREPLRFVEAIEQEQDGRAYRLDRDDGAHFTLMQGAGVGWEPQYRFTLQPHTQADYADMCHYHQTSPESSFTRKRVCTLATPDGRVTLSDLALIVTANGERTEQTLADEIAFHAALREYFGVDLT